MKTANVLLLWALLMPATFLTAQEFTGRVTDPTGAVVSKADVTVRNILTNVTTMTTTTGSGNYTVPFLKPGSYQVTASAAGFKTGVHSGLVLETDQTATVNFVLSVGATTESITVTGDALVDLGKADIGETVENARVTEIPLNGRDPGMLSELMAGAVWNGNLQWTRPFDDTQQQISVNGGGSGGVTLLMDGVSNSLGGINQGGNSRISYVPLVDSTQEIKIITNAYDAQYGLMAGGVEDVTLKSGTNKIHGDVYWYARRTWLDANSYQHNYFKSKATPGSDLSAFKTLSHKLDQYGFELDGPVFIPKVYDGRNKTFFTMQYERWNENTPNTSVTSVPDPAWLTGDFRSLVYKKGTSYSPISILDPRNVSQDPKTLAWTRVPFGPTDTLNPTAAANIIPASRLNPFALKVLSYYPKPNVNTAGAANPFNNNYTFTSDDTDQYRNALAKLDQQITANDHFSIHYGYWERMEVRDGNGLTGPAESGALPHVERSHTFTVEETHTFTPNLILDFRSNVTVRLDAWYNAAPFNPTALGWDPAMVAQMGPTAKNVFPYFDISEFDSIGGRGNGASTSMNLIMNPSLTWIKQKHAIHAGFDTRFWQVDNSLVGGGSNFAVDRQWTQTNCCGTWDPDSGNAIASLLLGNPTSGRDDNNSLSFFSEHYLAPYVQDDWKLTRKLTLNLGLRYDLLPGAVERHNRANGFSTTVVNDVNKLVSVPGYSQLLGGVTFNGVGGSPRAGYGLTLDDLQPRFGFAYAVDDKTVLRGGFGDSIRTPQNNEPAAGFSSSTQYIAADPTQVGNSHPNAASTIDHPFAISSLVQPTGSTLGTLEELGQGPWFLNPNYKNPTFWSYSLGAERQFFKHDVVNLSYVGSRLYNGDSDDGQINQRSLAKTAACNPQTGGNPYAPTCDNFNVANPFLNIAPFKGSNYFSQTQISGLDLTRPMPQFTDIHEWHLNGNRTWYNSLQVTGTHKWNSSLTLHGTWTWSKAMTASALGDQTYRTPSRAIDGNDRTHRVTLSGVYLLPVGRGRTLLPNANRIVDGAIGGWELSSLFIYQSGTPWGEPGNYLHNGYVKPHVQKIDGYIRMAAPCSNQYVQDPNNPSNWILKSLDSLYSGSYDGTCSQENYQAVPAYGQNFNTVYSGIRNPSSTQFDASMAKNFAIVESLRLQIRLDAFNVLNHPTWSMGADNNLNSNTFGEIKKGDWAPSNYSRKVQLSAKVVW